MCELCGSDGCVRHDLVTSEIVIVDNVGLTERMEGIYWCRWWAEGNG